MQINRAFAQIIPVMTVTLALSACGEPAPRAGDSRPTAPAYTSVQPLPPPPARRPLPPAPTPYTPPAYRPQPYTAQPYAAPPPGTDWRDVPLPAGDWSWAPRAGGSEARYGKSGTPPIAIMACDRAAGTVRIAVPTMDAQQTGATRSATITTSTSTNTFVATPQGTDALQTLAITLPTSNRMLDAMAYSRGRFRIEINGLAPVVLPSWSEVGRVVEDCRSQG